jgi:ABC-type antimicrobial peptide transport system permease subunit
MEHPQDNIKGYSPNQEAWLRFKKNKPGIFGLVVILFAALIAILGYLVSPDQTPNVNEQIPEVSLKSPGFEVTLLAVRKNRLVTQSSVLSKMIHGQENQYKFIPINKF